MEESTEEMNDQECDSGPSDSILVDDNSLLLQFQCLGTSDREALIKDFQRLLAPMQLSVEGCTFFLEMNNWNLQQAICSYFDYDAPKDHQSLPSMNLVNDVTIGEGEEIPPNTKFIKTWRIQNPGPDQWPFGCSLKFLSGAQLSNVDRIIVDPLLPNQTGDISVEMFSPSLPGTYEGQWRMTTSSGMYFGEIIWVIITVAEGGLLGVTQQMSTFNSLGSPRASNNFQVASDPNLAQRNPFGTSSAPSLHQSTDQSSSFSANHLPQSFHQVNNSNEVELEVDMRSDGCQIAVSGSFDGSPLVIHNLNIDRLKATPVDDNQENCFKICNDVLTRSPVADTRRASFGRSFSLSHSPQSSGLQPNQPSSDECNGFKQLQNPVSTSPASSMGPAPSTANEASNPGAAKSPATQFPPTPPSEDMML